jgi:hypothetical protein
VTVRARAGRDARPHCRGHLGFGGRASVPRLWQGLRYWMSCHMAAEKRSHGEEWTMQRAHSEGRRHLRAEVAKVAKQERQGRHFYR